MKRALILAVLPLLGACVVRIGDPEPVSVTSVTTNLRARAAKDVSLSLELQEGEPLHLGTSFGGIEVGASADSDPFVKATLTLHAETLEEARRTLGTYRLEAVREAGGLVVRLAGGGTATEDEDGVEVNRVPSVEIRAVVPSGTRLVLTSSSGDVVARGPLGHVRVRTSFGDVDLRDVAGADVATSSGDVTVEGVREGGCRASASFGDVEVEGRLTSVDAVASSGDVTVLAKAGSRVETPWRVASSFGDVALTLPDGIGCRVEARTSFGSLDTNLPGTRTDTVSGATLSATLGPGGETAVVETSSGDVTVRVR